MGKKDISINEWLEDKERFADLFNGLVFDGKQVVKAEELTLLPTGLKTSVRGKVRNNGAGYVEWIDQDRDICMGWKGIKLVVLGLENQEKIDYRMPLRTMLYDGLAYKKQADILWGDLSKQQRNRASDAERMSRLRKKDRLTPVITLVLYYGESGDWDGPRRLYDMLDMPSEQDNMVDVKSLIPDYKLNLIELDKINSDIFKNTDLQIMLGMVKYKKDTIALDEYIKKHREYFEDVDKATLDAWAVLMSFGKKRIRQLESMQETGEISKYKNGKGGYNVCKAIEDMISAGEARGRVEGRAEGEARGIIVMAKKFKLGKNEVLVELKNTMKLTDNQARKYVKMYW